MYAAVFPVTRRMESPLGFPSIWSGMTRPPLLVFVLGLWWEMLED